MKTWKIALGLLLCLLLFACLLPAACADGLTDLQDALDSYNGTGSPTSCNITEDINAQNVAFTIPNGFTLTISNGKTLQTGDFAIAQGGAVVLDGGALNTNTGALTLNGTLTIDNNGRYIGDGNNAAVLKAAYNAQRLVLVEEQWSISTFEAVQEQQHLQAAIDNADEIMDAFGDQHAMATIQIYFDWTVLKGSTADLGDAVIELDKTLTVCGTLKARRFSLYPSGALVVDGGTMVLPGADRLDGFNISNPNRPHAGGTVLLTDAWIDTNLNSWEDVADAVDPGYERISFEGDAGFIFRAETDDPDAAEELFAAAAQAIDEIGREYVKPVLTLRCDYEIPADMTLDVGELHMADGAKLGIAGQLVNTNGLRLDGGRIDRLDSGSLTGSGYIYVHCDDNPLSHLGGVTGYARSATQDSDGYWVLYQDEALKGLQTALENNEESYTLTGNVTIPTGMTLTGSSTKIIVPANLTLTVKGIFKPNELEVQQGGSLVLDGGALTLHGFTLDGNMTLNTLVGVPSSCYDDSLKAANDAGRITFTGDDAGFQLYRVVAGADEVDAAITWGKSVVAYSRRFYPVLNIGFAWTIDTNDEWDANGVKIDFKRDATIKGSLTAKELEIDRTCGVTVDGGDLFVPGSIAFGGTFATNAWVNLGAIGSEYVYNALQENKITFTGDAGFIFHRRTFSNDDATAEDWGAITGTKRILDRLGTEHTRAVALIDCDATIPESSYLNAGQGEIVIQSGKTLTVEGGLFGKTLEIEPGGSLAANGLISVDEFCDNGAVSVGESGFIQVKRSFSIGQDVTAFVLNGTLSIKNTALSDPTQLEVVANNGMLDIYVEMFDADALLAELNAPTGNFGDHFRRSLWVLFPWELSDDLTLPGHVHLCVSSQGSDQGNLTIPEGVLLTIPETGQLFTGGDEGETVVQLNGGLVNNGELALGDEMGYDPGEIAFGPKGFYAGFGTVTRLGRSDQILNDRTHADLLLPADLTKIESEALAGGEFDSVFIPDGTTSIADDAFGGREIVIFGELGSFAETYARGKEYCFAPVA